MLRTMASPMRLVSCGSFRAKTLNLRGTVRSTALRASISTQSRLAVVHNASTQNSSSRTSRTGPARSPCVPLPCATRVRYAHDWTARSQRSRASILNAVEESDLAAMSTSEAALEEIATVSAENVVVPGGVTAVPVPEKFDVEKEVARRRNFAIISHPDAGKTTLTEKLLLYGGAINEAGAVKARRASKHATSDWMALEKQRGISITSTAMQFEYQGYQINLLDTPGHADFSEDTYRTLSAADNAVMLIDAAKGLEPQTRKLFAVCRLNGLPVFTFVNKLDRPSLEPLEILDQIEKEFDLPTYAVSWPIGSGDRFRGVYYRPTKKVYLFDKTGNTGRSKGAKSNEYDFDDPALIDLIEEDLYLQLRDEAELLDMACPELDLEKVRDGKLSPIYFGSGMNNFGVELFLKSFLTFADKPRAHESEEEKVEPDDEDFSGFVFKLQANMDPKHRDRVAFLRVCSGTFERGMKVTVERTGKQLSLSRPQKMFAQEREVVESGFAGDIIGLNNPGSFAIGDTVYAGKRRAYPGIPSFSPELFGYLRNPNPSSYKQFQKGMDGLLGEGAVQVLYQKEGGRNDPILAAVGQLQFEVVQSRMETEYGVETILEPLPYQVARWVVEGWDAVEKVGKLFNAAVVRDVYDRPVLLFRNTWNLDQLLADVPDIGELLPYAMPPKQVIGKKGKK